MITEVTPYVNFNGNAAEALAFYADVLGADVKADMRWRDMPGGDVPPEMADCIMFACLDIGGQYLNLSDVPPQMTVENGTASNIMIEVSSPDALDAVFARLADGGTPTMPPDDMFWGARFAKVTDRFGLHWMLHHDYPATRG